MDDQGGTGCRMKKNGVSSVAAEDGIWCAEDEVNGDK